MIDNCQTIIVRHLKCCHSGWRGYGCRLYSWLLHKCFCKLLHTKLKQLECTISAFLPIFFQAPYTQYTVCTIQVNKCLHKCNGQEKFALCFSKNKQVSNQNISQKCQYFKVSIYFKFQTYIIQFAKPILFILIQNFELYFFSFPAFPFLFVIKRLISLCWWIKQLSQDAQNQNFHIIIRSNQES